ncbi:MAG: TIGR00730 family Rossman fold protein [Anaerolineae bacterium]|nr:TIGR00730 family Rossman fold protein [Anaerolineae bacterium]
MRSLRRRGLQICVYCSSSAAVHAAYVEAACTLGRELATRGHALIYGGADVGLMGALARAVHQAGGTVIGVIPRRLAERDLMFCQADEMLVAETMAERKRLMEERAEAFVALPGGFGTLEELLQVLTLKQLGYLQAPIVLLNVKAEPSAMRPFDHLLAHFEWLYQERFAKPDYRALYHVADTPVQALDYVESYTAPALPSKWF